MDPHPLQEQERCRQSHMKRQVIPQEFRWAHLDLDNVSLTRLNVGVYIEVCCTIAVHG
jgi:hypothetical protein